jgi:colicin import membrane protein
MPPKKSAKAAAPRKELTEEDMQRMGMAPEQIAAIMASRGMSSEDKAKQNAEDEKKRAFDTKRAQYEKQHANALLETEKEEAAARGALYFEFGRGADAADAATAKRVEEERVQALRDRQAEARRRLEELRAKQERDRQEALESWGALPEADREARIRELREEHDRKQREEREAREAEDEAAAAKAAEAEERRVKQREKRLRMQEERDKFGGDDAGIDDNALEAEEAAHSMLDSRTKSKLQPVE